MSIISVAKWKVLIFVHLCRDAATFGHFLFSVSGQIMPRFQWKWTHSDPGSQNLDRSPSILVYGSFVNGWEFQATLTHHHQKAASLP